MSLKGSDNLYPFNGGEIFNRPNDTYFYYAVLSQVFPKFGFPKNGHCHIIWRNEKIQTIALFKRDGFAKYNQLNASLYFHHFFHHATCNHHTHSWTKVTLSRGTPSQA